VYIYLLLFFIFSLSLYMDNGPHGKPFRIDHRKQLQDIYIFEQKLREGAAEIDYVRKKYQALMFSIVVWNGVAVWHACAGKFLMSVPFGIVLFPMLVPTCRYFLVEGPWFGSFFIIANVWRTLLHM